MIGHKSADRPRQVPIAYKIKCIDTFSLHGSRNLSAAVGRTIMENISRATVVTAVADLSNRQTAREAPARSPLARLPPPTRISQPVQASTDRNQIVRHHLL